MHASRPGILCFDGAINRRKAAVKRIESQVRPFCPALFATLRFSTPLAFAHELFLVPSRFLVLFSAAVVKRPAPFAGLSLSHACSLARPARSGPSAHHYVTNVAAVRRSVGCHVLRGRLFTVVCAASWLVLCSIWRCVVHRLHRAKCKTRMIKSNFSHTWRYVTPLSSRIAWETQTIGFLCNFIDEMIIVIVWQCLSRLKNRTKVIIISYSYIRHYFSAHFALLQ